MAFTSEQTRAVQARGKVLVSASAGAGKTTVMIKRLADILCAGASLDNVLAVTFTKKAAANMKEKLRSELVSRLSECGEAARENIRQQLGKINAADISTIHSFCARLVRTYFYAFDGVDASFEILAGEAETAELRSRAMDNLFDRLYGKGDVPADEKFLYVVERLKKKRSDISVREAVLRAYDRLRIEPDYESVAARCESAFSREGFEKVCACLGSAIGRRCAFYAAEVDKFSRTLNFSSCADMYFAVLDDMRENFAAVAEKEDVFARSEKLTLLTKPRVREENAAADAKFAEFSKAMKKRYENLFRDIKTREEEWEAFEESGRLARAFTDLVLQFDREYAAVKREESVLDYGDLEQLAYRLVCGGGDVAAEIKKQINGKYSFVFVDEYQDVNPIQDAIINAVAGGDLFKVGDVKQAIYGFRGSRSHFFAGQLKKAAEEDGCVILPHNFRSSGAVVDAVNELFSAIMTPSVCGFDYIKEGHAMISGNQIDEACENSVDVSRGDNKTAQNGAGEISHGDNKNARGDNKTARGEACLCVFEDVGEQATAPVGVYSIVDELPAYSPPDAKCNAIKKLIDELLRSEIYDSRQKRMRPVQQGDICVLTRKKNKKSVAELERALLAEGYRVDGASEANVCDFPYVRRLVDVLSYIDNSEQDIALVSALLSPLGEMNEDDLAAIRVYGGVGREAPPFRRCAEKYARENDDKIARRLRAFYGECARLKRLSSVVGAARLIDEIISKGGFVTRYLSGEKLAAVRRLQREAYSAGGELSLNAFLAKLKAAQYKVGSPLPPSSDSIKIMTMHASKGLEFPVVIISDISAGFGGDDRGDMPYDEQFGFAPMRYDPERRVAGSTVLRKLCKMRADAEELKNEVNLFYVACTRAQNSLYIMCRGGNKYDEAGTITASRYADLFDQNGLKNIVKRHICADECEKSEDVDAGGALIFDGLKDESLYSELSATFGARICGGDTSLPVKSSATKILGLTAEDEIHPVLFEETDESETSSGVAAGLAYHAFLQHCDFSVRDIAGIKAELKSLLDCGKISEEYFALLDGTQLARILSLPRFKGIENCEIYREREFLFSLSSAEYSALAHSGGKASGGGEVNATERGDVGSVIIQGAIDLLAVWRENGVVAGADIIDYKYSGRSDGALEEKYSAQLSLYQKAVARIYKLPEDKVTRTIINIRACSEIPLD